MTSPDPELERLQREYEQACVAYCEKILPGACFDIRDPAGEVGMAAAHAGLLLRQARQRAAQQHSDEEIITQMFSHFGPSARIEQPSLRTTGTTYIIYPDDIRQALSALRAAGWKIVKEPRANE